jgi:hypothetical protein
VTLLGVIFRHLLGDTEENREKASQDRRCRRDSNQALREFNSEPSPLEPTWSVISVPVF